MRQANSKPTGMWVWGSAWPPRRVMIGTSDSTMRMSISGTWSWHAWLRAAVEKWEGMVRSSDYCVLFGRKRDRLVIGSCRSLVGAIDSALKSFKFCNLGVLAKGKDSKGFEEFILLHISESKSCSR